MAATNLGGANLFAIGLNITGAGCDNESMDPVQEKALELLRVQIGSLIIALCEANAALRVAQAEIERLKKGDATV